MVEKLLVPLLARSLQSTAHPRAVSPEGQGALWSIATNVRFDDQLVQRRPVVVATSIGDPADLSANLVSAARDGESPVWIWSGLNPKDASYTTQTGSCAVERFYGPGSTPIVLITNRQAYRWLDGTWSPIAPTYSAGTVTATNGSTSVTGAGTAWVTRGISPHQAIQIAGAWYTICSLSSDTAMTISPAFSGTTGGGKAYTIRRTWCGGVGLTRESLLFAEIFNDDLYIAGTFLARADGQVSPAVIKVTDVTRPALGATTYLTAAVDLTGTLDRATDSRGSFLTEISGMKILDDGRVVLAANGSHIIYSSHLDTAVWTTSPGGQTPILEPNGSITALGSLGRLLTIHYEDGIVLGQPTGADDPPLTYGKPLAAVGCYAPRTLVEAAGRELYLGSDFRVHAFDGNAEAAVDGAVHNLLEAEDRLTGRHSWHAQYLPRRQEYQLLKVSPVDYSTDALVLNEAGWARRSFSAPVTALSRQCYDTVSYETSIAYVGISNWNPYSNSQGNLLWKLSQVGTSDTPNWFGSSLASHLRTLTLDFGYPDQKKVIHRVRLLARGTASETITITIGTPGHSIETRSVTESFGSSEERWLHFTFTPAAREAFYIEISSVTELLDVALLAMIVDFEVQADNDIQALEF